MNISYSKLFSMKCAGWNPIKLHKYKQYHIMKMRKQNEGIIVNTINWLHSNISILMYTEREYIYVQRERERERESESERDSNPL